LSKYVFKRFNSCLSSSLSSLFRDLPRISNFSFHNLLPVNSDLNSLPSLKLLGFGCKFIPRPQSPSLSMFKSAIHLFVRRFAILDFFSNVVEKPSNSNFDKRFKTVSNWLPPTISPTAFHIVNFISNFTAALPSLVRNSSRSPLSKQLSRLKSNPFVKIVQSDKNLGLCALSIFDYNKLIQTHLLDFTHYSCLGSMSDPLSSWKTISDDIWQQHGILLARFRRYFPKEAQIFKFLKASQFKLPIFHILPKLHKSGNLTSRPIVGAVNWITTNWAIFVCSVLELIELKFVLRNSFSLVEQLESKPVTGNAILITADVASLYTNMSLPLLFDFLARRGVEPFIIDIIMFICHQNYFLYGSKVFKQLDGIAMGTNCAVHCANIFLSFFDEEFAPFFSFYSRYIDDIFAIFDGSESDLDLIFLKMNNAIPGITLNFTYCRTSVDFLDLTIFKHDGLICFHTFQKALNIYQYLPPTSFHPPACLAGFIKGELIRFMRCNTLLKHRRLLFLLFFRRLVVRGYSSRFLNRIFSKVSIFSRGPNQVKPSQPTLIPLVIPWTRSPAIKLLKDLMIQLNKHMVQSEDVKFLIAFKRNPNLLQLCSRSNISFEQERILSGQDSSEEAPFGQD